MDINSWSESTNNDNESISGSTLKKPTFAQIGVLYSVVVIIFILLGSRLQRSEFYSGILVTEFGIIALPAVLMLFLYRYHIKSILRLNKAGFLNMFLIFWIMVFALPVVGAFNFANLVIIKQIFGRIIVQPVPVAQNLTELILNILVIGGSAGICEEIMFRGTIQRGFERLGTVKALLITSLLFGLLHVDFQKLLGTFLLGILIGFIVYRTNSIIGGMLAHFTNNSLAVLLSYAANKAMELIKSSGLEQGQNNMNVDLPSLANIGSAQIIAAVVIYGSIFIFCALALTGLIIALIKNTQGRPEKPAGDSQRSKQGGFLWALPGIALIGFLYFAQGIRMLGLKVEAVEGILRFMGLK